MTEPTATLILLFVAALLVPLGAWAIRSAKRSRRSMASLAGIMMVLGAFLTSDPPPPPKAETATPRPDEDDEPLDPHR